MALYSETYFSLKSQVPSLKLQLSYAHFHVNLQPGASRFCTALKGHFPLGGPHFFSCCLGNKLFPEEVLDAAATQDPKPHPEAQLPL